MLKPLRFSDLKGLARLAVGATGGVISLVEGVHRSVESSLGLPGGDRPGHTAGLTGLIYKSVRGVTSVVGTAIDAAFTHLEPWIQAELEDHEDSPARDVLLSALNGVMGDRLVEDNHPLAMTMALRYAGSTLDLAQLPPMPEASGKLLILIHGLCMSDLGTHARYREHAVEPGAALAEELGYTPIYVRYNSGLHTSLNGRELSAQLERLVTHWPTPVEEVSVVAHSMGGLVIRSAAYFGEEHASVWRQRLTKIVFLGTPHHGAPLEQAGSWLDVILASTAFTIPFTRLSQIRSAGITDLRHGHVLDQDWQGNERFERRPDGRHALPLPATVRSFAVAATRSSESSVITDRVGDGLVPLRSALGEHDDDQLALDFPADCRWIARQMNHMELLSSPRVTEQMIHWLGPSTAPSPIAALSTATSSADAS